ncbi:Predicted nuclease of the RNAse H fold, HicB family [Gammaproteobacteria bacterium]
MTKLPYSIVIEATKESNFFCFYSPDLEGFTGAGYSVEDCILKARQGMAEHVTLLQQNNLTIPAMNPASRITIRDESGMLEAA